jgi:hypothetical protein
MHDDMFLTTARRVHRYISSSDLIGCFASIWRAPAVNGSLESRVPRVSYAIALIKISHTRPHRIYALATKDTPSFIKRIHNHRSAQFCTSRLSQPGDGPRRPLPRPPTPIAITPTNPP